MWWHPKFLNGTRKCTMPYIKMERRKRLELSIKLIIDFLREVPEEYRDGEINYIVTVILKRSYDPKYFNYNRAIGVLECVKQEFYRKVVAPYEELKEKENGSVD